MKVAALVAILAVTGSQAAAVAEADPKKYAPWSSCGFPGIICAKTKRSALAVAEAIAEPKKYAPWSSCGFPGIICAKARRSLEELGSTTEKVLDNILALDKDEAAAHQRNSLITAHFPGTKAVNKREADPKKYAPWSSCGFPGIICAKAKRGIELIQEEFPNIHKEECFAEGGECHTILKARAAFDEAVRREGGPTKAAWHRCGHPSVTCARDVYEYAQAQLNGTAPAEVYECSGPNGECTKAEEYFKELDAALTKATNEVLKA